MVTERLIFFVLDINSNRKLVSMKKYYMIFIKIKTCNWTLSYMWYAVETYVYTWWFILTKGEKKPFSRELCMFCQEKNTVSKKVDRRYKTLSVSSHDFQNL